MIRHALTLCLVGPAVLATACAHAARGMPSAAPAPGGSVEGVVLHATTQLELVGVRIVLQCACLPEPRETVTNEAGLFHFTDLPPGRYTVQALAGKADFSRIFDLSACSEVHARFSLDPSTEQHEVVPVASSPALEGDRSVGLEAYHRGRRSLGSGRRQRCRSPR